jgi:hypothetical protein
MNFELKVKDITVETFILTGKINNINLINNLINCSKSINKNTLNDQTHVKGTFTGFNSLNENEYFHAFLKNILPQIQKVYFNSFAIQSSWANILTKGGEVKEHTHSNSAFSGILYLTEGGPGTFFKEHNITVEEEVGKYVLFSSILSHSVKPLEKDLERITIAFNFNQIKKWEDKENFKWLNKYEI